MMSRVHAAARVIGALVTIATAIAILPGASGAQTTKGEWKVVVRIVPNPLPAGRCATIRVEVQDDEGYQSTQLGDGRAVDSRTFKYENSLASAFRWQNDNPAGGVLCAPDGAAAVKSVVTVTLPNGLTGTAELLTLATGQTGPPVQYPPQARLRPAGTVRSVAVATQPGTIPARLASRSQTVATPPLTMTGAYLLPVAMSITTGPLAMNGAYLVPVAMSITTGPLGMSGTSFAPKPMTVATGPLAMIGSYFRNSSQTLATSPLAMTGSYFAERSQSATTTALSMTGSYFAATRQTVITPQLSMTGAFSATPQAPSIPAVIKPSPQTRTP